MHPFRTRGRSAWGVEDFAFRANRCCRPEALAL
jgi:hypothetical protein